jgi:hypothetical protein
VFPLDGPPSVPEGDLALTLLVSRRFGVGVRGGVSGEWSQAGTSGQGAAIVTARRLPVAVELRVDLALRRGAIRLSVGPEVALWLASARGIAHPSSRVLADPGAIARAAYHVLLGRFTLEAGVQLDLSFLVDNLMISGLGTITHTPRASLSPFLSAGVRL